MELDASLHYKDPIMVDEEQKLTIDAYNKNNSKQRIFDAKNNWQACFSVRKNLTI